MNIFIQEFALIISLFFFMGCDSTTNENTPRSNSNNKIKEDSKLVTKQKISERIKEYNLKLDYPSFEETEVSDEQISEIVKWGVAFRSDSLFNTQTNFKSNFVIQIEGLTTLNITKGAAIKRTNYLENKLNKVLGFDAEDIPIFKTIKSIKYGNRSDNYIEISINRLVF